MTTTKPISGLADDPKTAIIEDDEEDTRVELNETALRAAALWDPLPPLKLSTTVRIPPPSGPAAMSSVPELTDKPELPPGGPTFSRSLTLAAGLIMGMVLGALLWGDRGAVLLSWLRPPPPAAAPIPPVVSAPRPSAPAVAVAPPAPVVEAITPAPRPATQRRPKKVVKLEGLVLTAPDSDAP
jgi:hypothetical protein